MTGNFFKDQVSLDAPACLAIADPCAAYVASFEGKRTLALAGLGSNHPKVREVDALIAGVEEKLSALRVNDAASRVMPKHKRRFP